jgi:hypothetical protein
MIGRVGLMDEAFAIMGNMRCEPSIHYTVLHRPHKSREHENHSHKNCPNQLIESAPLQEEHEHDTVQTEAKDFVKL